MHWCRIVVFKFVRESTNNLLPELPAGKCVIVVLYLGSFIFNF